MFYLFVCCIIIACATPTAYYKNLNNLIVASRFSDAADLAERSKTKNYDEKNALLYYLDKGYLLHLSGKYEESNLCFEKAKTIAKDYFTKSITTEASTLLVSDNTRPYYGEDFERALIHIFCALNYIYLKKESDAIVEAKQVDHFLKTLEVNYGIKNVYKEDPFARYLMGMIYENQKEYNDAYISYYKALQSYQQYGAMFNVSVPAELVNDTLRCAQKLGFTDEIKEIEKKWNVSSSEIKKISADEGELVVIHYNGISPYKIDNFFEISFGKAWIYVGQVQPKGEEEAQVEQARAIARNILSSEQVRMAFPKYVSSPYRISNFIVKQENSDVEKSGTLVENIGAIAEKSLESRNTAIHARTIARAAIKFVLARKISQAVEKKSGDAVVGWLAKKTLSVAATATETADKRSWRSLPDQIRIAKILLPQGSHSIKLTFEDKNGFIIDEKNIENINIKPGKKTFITIRTAK